MPQKMYTKPVSLSQGHAFKAPKAQVSYEPSTWDQYFERKEMINDTVPLYITGNPEGHVFLCLHGAGHSAMSFAVLSKYLRQTSTVCAFDFRGHGEHYRKENENDLSEETLVNDTLEVLKYVVSKFPEQSIILVGHSLGGAIATKTATLIQEKH